jgi:hypothetical protein
VVLGAGLPAAATNSGLTYPLAGADPFGQGNERMMSLFSRLTYT